MVAMAVSMSDGWQIAAGTCERPRGSDFGFALSEALIATLVLTSGLLAMARLIDIAVLTTSASRLTTMTTIVADQKLEELRADVELQSSPVDAFQRNTPGFVDHVDAFGIIVGSDTQPPRGAMYTRRWSVVPLATDPEHRVIRVRVTPIPYDREIDKRVAGEARAFTIVPSAAR